MAVSQTISAISTAPQLGVDSKEVFVQKAETVWGELKTVVPQLNTAFSQINTTETNINAKEVAANASAENAAQSALAASGSANFKGTWSSSTAYTVGQSVLGSDNAFYVALLASTNQNPTTTSGYWKVNVPLGAIGNINNPLLDMPLKNSLAMKAGVGSATFTRASTATYIDRYGVLKTAAIDEPRFEKEGYLNEGASTNLLLQSEAFTGWGFNSCSQSNDATTYNPYGILGFSKFTASGASAWFNATTGTLTQPTPTTPITISFFIKEGTTTRIRLCATEGGVFQNDIVINIKDGTEVIDALTFSVNVEYLANGIKRIKATYTPIITHTAFGFRFYMQNNTGDSTAGDYMWFSGAQLEALPFATSYIPTKSAAVTRATDFLNVTRKGNMPNIEANGVVSTAVDINSFGNTSSNQWIWGLYSSNIDGIGIQITYSGYIRSHVASADNDNSVGVYNNIKHTKQRVVATIDNNGNALYVNGVYKAFNADTNDRITDTQNSAFSTIRIGAYTPTSSIQTIQFFGHISNFRIWDKALTATEVALC